jgi:hypothetical protein
MHQISKFDIIYLPLTRDAVTALIFDLYRTQSRIFVESGTFIGNGIARAFASGYEKVYTCDINPDFVSKAINRFKGCDLTAYHEPSQTAFKKIFSEIKTPSVIWLDGHMMPDELGHVRPYTVKDGLEFCPLLEEIKIIRESVVNSHTIIIDDFQCFGTWLFDGLEFNVLRERILEINPDYKFTLYNGDIMVCNPETTLNQ